jgi:hypothetical protein
MIKVKIEQLLIQVLQAKQKDSHPCLEYLIKRLCYLRWVVATDARVNDDNDEKNHRLKEKYSACCEIYKEFEKSKDL